ncbi:MAG: hypothetical protein U0457_18255 [Candidatus Sericytochromatia bacterium]
MNNKVFLGTVFGIIIGIGLSFATPILSQEITINSKSVGSKKQTKPLVEKEKISSKEGDPNLAEAVVLLKEIRDLLKDNSKQNSNISEGINNLNKKFGSNL